MGRREQRRLEATRVQVEVVWKRTQTLGTDDARNVRIDGTVRVRDVFTFQSADVETWSKWCDDSEDLVLGCFEGHIVKVKRPVRWRFSCLLKNR